MMKTMVFLILIIAFSLCLDLYGSSEKVPENLSNNNTKIYKEWINMGLGFGTMPFEINMAISYNFGYRSFHQIAYNFFEEFPLFGTPLDIVRAINYGIGVRKNNRFLHISIFSGPSFLYIRREYKGSERRKKTIGIVVNTQLFIKPIAEIGLGVELYYNLNFEKNVESIRFSFHFNNAK